MNRKITLESQKRHIKEWQMKGSGNHKDYHPWLTVRSVSSKGKSSRVKGRASGRVHHFLSQIETNTFYIFDWLESTVDVREQYPLLPVEETLQIAEDIGVKHPIHPQGKFPVVMTTDFLVDMQVSSESNQEAVAVKASKDLEDERTLEKLEIERVFFGHRSALLHKLEIKSFVPLLPTNVLMTLLVPMMRKGFFGTFPNSICKHAFDYRIHATKPHRSTNWSIVSERELDNQTVKNVIWIGRADAPENISPDELPLLVGELFDRLSVLDGPLGANCRSLDRVLGLGLGTAISIFRYALRTRLWRIDLSSPLHEDLSMPLLQRS